MSGLLLLHHILNTYSPNSSPTREEQLYFIVDRSLLLVELTCLSLSTNIGDAIAMARMAGNVPRIPLQPKMDRSTPVYGLVDSG